MKESIGNKYGISMKQILSSKRQTVKPKSGKFIDDDRTFFCSELIAKAYKVLGIIEDDDKACSNYFPSSFSMKGDLKVKEPAELCNE